MGGLNFRGCPERQRLSPRLLVIWNGFFRVPGFASSHQSVVTITAADIAQSDPVVVFVFNPADGNTTSFSRAIGNTFISGCSAKDLNAVVFTIKSS